MSSVCPVCQGRGGRIVTPCPTCHGTGREPSSRKVNVRIPAGVNDGQRIKIKGKGNPGTHGGPAGDLFVDVHVSPDARFDRRGRNVTTTVNVPLTAAMLGTTVEVPTLDDPVTLKIPAGTQPVDDDARARTRRARRRQERRRRPPGHGQRHDPQETEQGTEVRGREVGGRVEKKRYPVTERQQQHAVYVISVFAELAGVHPQTLRNYERSGLLNPQRTSGGSRRFSDADLAALRRIQELTNEGVNLEGVKKILRSKPNWRHSSTTSPRHATKPGRTSKRPIANTAATSSRSRTPSWSSSKRVARLTRVRSDARDVPQRTSTFPSTRLCRATRPTRRSPVPATVVVGTQWGDEGKGKLTDLLSRDMDMVVRYQGGHNAGHRIVVDDVRPSPCNSCPRVCSTRTSPRSSATASSSIPRSCCAELDTLECQGRRRLSTRRLG